MKVNKSLGLIAVAAVVVILNLPAPVSWKLKLGFRDEVIPFQNLLGLAIAGMNRLWRAAVAPPEASHDSERMLQEIAALREETRLLRWLRVENDELRDMLEFKRRSQHRLLPCEVIGRGDISGWWRTITLSKGLSDGISPGMAVISVGGLVGRTWEVAGTSSTVLLITDPSFKVSCRFVRTGRVGILQGRGVEMEKAERVFALVTPRPFHVEYVSKDARILPGDELVTSGLGDVFPEGLFIGYALRAVMDSSGLCQKVEVVPSANLEDLKRVFVVMD